MREGNQTMRERVIRLIQGLLWAGSGMLLALIPALCAWTPDVVGRALKGEPNWFMLGIVLQYIFVGVLVVLTILRLVHVRTPRWLWIGSTLMMIAATGIALPEMLGEIRAEVWHASIHLAIMLGMPALAAAVLMLHGLWTLLERRGDAACG